MGRRERKRVFKVQVLEIKSATMMKNVFRDKLYFRENPLLRGEELIRGWKFLSTTSPQISPFLSKNLRINEKIRRNILRTKFRKKEKIPKEKKYPDEANSTPMEQHVRGYTFRSPSHESLSKLYIRESGDEWTGTGSESYAMINGRPLGSASHSHTWARGAPLEGKGVRVSRLTLDGSSSERRANIHRELIDQIIVSGNPAGNSSPPALFFNPPLHFRSQEKKNSLFLIVRA